MNTNKPLLVLPKGRLYNDIKKLFEYKDVSLPDSNSRQYYFPNWSEDCRLFIAKPKSIPDLMYSKFVEFCFCGYDIMKNSEHFNDTNILLHTGFNKVNMCLCSKLSYNELTHLNRPVIVATEFYNIASEYFTKLGVPHYIINTYGSTEGYINIGADCIIDIVETGETLKANNINIIDNLFETDTCLFGHKNLCDCVLPMNLQKLFT